MQNLENSLPPLSQSRAQNHLSSVVTNDDGHAAAQNLDAHMKSENPVNCKRHCLDQIHLQILFALMMQMVI